jgi:hypothetical protein
LDRPTRIDDESGADDRTDQRFPCVGTFVGENDDHAAIWNQRAVACLKRAEHSVFVSFLRCGLVAAEAARIVD